MTTAHIPAAKIESTTAPNSTRKSRWPSGRSTRQGRGRAVPASRSTEPAAASRPPDRGIRSCAVHTAIGEVADGAPCARALALERGEHAAVEARRPLPLERTLELRMPRRARRASDARSPPSRWRAAASRPRALRRPRCAANSAVTSRRFVCFVLCHGSGKNSHSSETDAAGSRCASTSGAFASTSLRLRTSARSASSIVRARPERKTSTARKSTPGRAPAACTIAWP